MSQTNFKHVLAAPGSCSIIHLTTSHQTPVCWCSLRPSLSWRAYKVWVNSLYESLLATIHKNTSVTMQSLETIPLVEDIQSENGKSLWESLLNTSAKHQYVDAVWDHHSHGEHTKCEWTVSMRVYSQLFIKTPVWRCSLLRPSPSWRTYKVRMESLYENLS